MNHYEVLEVSQNASIEVIRAAYKSLMQRCHPDKNPVNAATAARAALVVHAYDVLSDVERRAIYDLELRTLSAASTVAVAGERPAVSAARRVPVRHEGNFWHTLFVVVFVAFAGWLVTWSVKQWLSGGTADPLTGTRPPTGAIPHDMNRTGENVTAGPHDTPGNIQPAVRRETLVYATMLNIGLRKPYNPSELSGRVLSIPELSVTLAMDVDGSSSNLRKMTMQFDIPTIVDQLANVRYEELLGRDGEYYLKQKILETIVRGRSQEPTFAALAAERDARSTTEGIEVLLPRSFTVE